MFAGANADSVDMLCSVVLEGDKFEGCRSSDVCCMMDVACGPGSGSDVNDVKLVGTDEFEYGDRNEAVGD